MNIIFVLIPLGLILLCVAIAAFIWAVRHHQFDDLEGEAWRILFDDALEDQKEDAKKSDKLNTPDDQENNSQ